MRPRVPSSPPPAQPPPAQPPMEAARRPFRRRGTATVRPRKRATRATAPRATAARGGWGRRRRCAMRTGRFRPPSTSSELGRSRPSSHAISPDLEQVRDVRGCVLRCARHCARCAFVSVSLPERDCSWCVRPVLHPPAPPCTSLHPPASHCISLHPPRSPTRCPPCCLRCRCEPPTLSQTRPKADPDPKPATRTPTHQVPRLRSRRSARISFGHPAKRKTVQQNEERQPDTHTDDRGL